MISGYFSHSEQRGMPDLPTSGTNEATNARLPVDLAGALRTKPRAFVVPSLRPTCSQRKGKVAFVWPAIEPRPSPLAMRRVVTREFQRFPLTSEAKILLRMAWHKRDCYRTAMIPDQLLFTNLDAAS